jgi:hypothetical protein
MGRLLIFGHADAQVIRQLFATSKLRFQVEAVVNEPNERIIRGFFLACGR